MKKKEKKNQIPTNISEGFSMPLDALTLRLNALVTKKFKINEMYNIIRDFMLNPLMAEMIEGNNRMHKVHASRDGAYITALKLLREKPKRAGFFYNLSRFFSPWETVLKIKHSNGIFVCEYSKYSYFTLVDKIKDEFDKKLEKPFGCKFVVINRE